MTRQLSDDPRPLLSGGANAPDEQAAARLLSRLPEMREDRVAQERVWRALGQTARRPRWEWRPVAAAVVAGLAMVALVVAFSPRRHAPAILELAAGRVLLATPKADWVGGQAGASLPAASRVRTDSASRAVISLARSAVIAEPGTDFALDALGRDTFLRLSAGTLVAEVEPRRAGESFVVLTTNYRVTVKGTIFSVQERSADDVEVSVSRGRVEVTGAGGSWPVAAGQAWTSQHPSVLGEDSITSGQRQLLDGTVQPRPRSPIEVTGEQLVISAAGVKLGPAPVSWNAPLGPTELRGDGPAGQVVGEAVASTDHLTHVVLVPAAPALPAPPQPAVAPLHLPPPTNGGKALSDQAAFSAAGMPERPVREAHSRAFGPPAVVPARQLLARLDPAPPFPTPALSPSPVAPPASDPLQQALDLIRSRRYPEAERALAALAARGGSGADLALYELADVRQRHLHDPAGALSALQRYRAAYPGGALMQEAEISMIELELARPDPGAALSQIDRFLSAHPNSERAADVHWLLGNLLRTRGDFAGALESYRRVQGGDHEADALFFRAVCQERLGQVDGAAETLRAYVQRFPSATHAGDARRALEGH